MDIPSGDVYIKELNDTITEMKRNDCQHILVYHGFDNGMPIFKCHTCKQIIKTVMTAELVYKTDQQIETKPDSDISSETINKLHYIEVLDRVHVIQCTIDDMIRNHPAVKEPLEIGIRQSIDEIQDNLTYIYQWASMRFDELCEE